MPLLPGGTFFKEIMPQEILSDGETIEVRTLGIFELDAIEREIIGPFTYPVELLGGIVKHAEWDIGQYEEQGVDPPKKPDTPEHLIEENTPEWYQLRDWKRYETALWHRKRRMEAAAQYYEDVAAYILANCIGPEDLPRIVTEEDWEKVYRLALVPQLTIPLIVRTLSQVYNAKFGDKEIWDALNKASSGSGSYNALRLWENQWANQMGLSDLDLATLPVEERARRVCAMKIDDWMEFLEIDRIRKREALNADNPKS